jgi:hypothetical protein
MSGQPLSSQNSASRSGGGKAERKTKHMRHSLTLLAVPVLSLALASALHSQEYTGPADPTNPSQPLYKNQIVKSAIEKYFSYTNNGQARSVLAEAGCAIEYKDGRIYFDHCLDSVHADTANELHITVDRWTIAVFHTHGMKGNPHPSPGDCDPNSIIPDFVKSVYALSVTVPHTNQYVVLQ